jgi:RIO kinase 1
MIWEKKISRLDNKIDEAKKRIKGGEDRKIFDEVFDKSTLLSLYHLSNRGVLDLLYGALKSGKESNIFLGKKGKKSLAVKIHLVGTSDYSAMLKYIDGDIRFKGIKRSRRSIVYTWVRKEYKNLERAIECGVPVPKPLAFRNNVLIMEFIGRRNKPYPMLKEVKLDDPERIYQEILHYIKKLYCQGNLVHSDMSEYNILMKGDQPVVIDLSAAVVREHPMAEEFLMRDIFNITKFFGEDNEKALKLVRDC